MIIKLYYDFILVLFQLYSLNLIFYCLSVALMLHRRTSLFLFNILFKYEDKKSAM